MTTQNKIIDSSTFETSWDMIIELKQKIYDYLYKSPKWHDKYSMLEMVDDIERELMSWRKSIKEVKEE